MRKPLLFGLAQQLRQLGKDGGDALRLVSREAAPAETGDEAPSRNTCRQGPARWRPSPQSSYPVPRLTRAAGSGAQAWPDHSARRQRIKVRVRSVRAPVSPKQDTLGDCGGDDASAPLLVLIGINLAPAEFKQGNVVTQTEIPMAKHILMLTTVTFALLCGGIPARAQGDTDDPAITRHWEEVQQNQGDEEDSGRMGHGMMRHCMRQCMAEDGRMGEGWRKHGMMRHGGMMGPMAMRIIFALIDRDSDGTIHWRSFKRLTSVSSKRWTPTKMAPLVRRRC